MGTNRPATDPHEKTGYWARSVDGARYVCWLLMLVTSLLVSCNNQPTCTPDHVATAVAIERAVRGTLTSEAPRPTSRRAPSATPSPDAVASGVAVQRAVAATLTAEQGSIPAAPHTTSPTTPTPDLVATGVAIQKAIAATLTADAPTSTATLEPRTPVTTSTPSITAEPAQPTSTPSPSGPDCTWWLEAQDHVSTYQCICGVVTETYDDPNSSAFFINFSSDRTGYYAVSFNLSFHGLASKCVRICGVVQMYKDRPQTVISETDQLQELDTCP